MAESLDNNSPEPKIRPAGSSESLNKKFTSTIAGASILLTVVGLMSRGLGLIREIVFAGSFGLSKAYDLFLVGTVIPLTLNTVIMYIAQNYFIPVYNRLKSESPQQAKSFISKSLIMFISGGFIIMGVLYFFSVNIISLYVNNPGIEEEKIAVIVLKIYSFTLPLNAAFSVLAAYLYSEFEFKLPTISQLLVNIAVILIVIIFSGEIGVISIAYGYLLGIILQLVFVFIYTLKLKINLLIFKGSGTKLFYWNSGLILIIIIETLSQVYLISDRYFLNQVDKGGIAALNYSMNVFLLPISIISVALSTALFPSFSKSFVENNINEINGRLSKFFSVNLYIFVPLTFIFLFFGDIIISILFQRGAFKTNDSSMTFETLKYFSLSLIFYSSYTILNKLMYSIELIKELLIITILGCSLKVFFNFIFVSYMKQDGLALSSSISFVFFFGASLLTLKRKLNFKNMLLKKLFLILLNSILAFILSFVLSKYIIKYYFDSFQSDFIQLLLFIILFSITIIYTDKNIFKISVNFIPHLISKT